MPKPGWPGRRHRVPIDVLYFASLREKLGCDAETVSLVEGETVGQLAIRLAGKHGEAGQVLLERSVRAARNQTLVDSGELLAAGDEVAFFPPVTGG